MNTANALGYLIGAVAIRGWSIVSGPPVLFDIRGGALVAHGAPRSIALYSAVGGAGSRFSVTLPWLPALRGSRA